MNGSEEAKCDGGLWKGREGSRKSGFCVLYIHRQLGDGEAGDLLHPMNGIGTSMGGAILGGSVPRGTKPDVHPCWCHPQPSALAQLPVQEAAT